MAGFTTVGQCEYADYPTKVLEKHWPDVPRWRDIRTLTGDSFYERTGLRTVDVISGGFPCQPFSVAGDRRGKEDDRYLWPEMLRVIQELKPTWVIGENVPGIVNLALDTVLSDLENSGYSAQAFNIPACGVDAPHKRERIAILAYALDRRGTVRRDWQFQDLKENGREGLDNRTGAAAAITGERRENESGTSGMADGLRTGVYETVADPVRFDVSRRGEESVLDATFTKCSSREREREQVPQQSERTAGMHSAWADWPDEPGVDRVVDRLPDRVDRLKCLGNAVVPQQFYAFFEAIAKIERGK